MQLTAKISAFPLLLFIVAITAGCGKAGPSLHEVNGRIEVDGKPADQALVFMHKQGRNALTDPIPYGTCKADGTFVIETPGVGVGAEEGEYTITVYWPDMSKPEDGNGQRPDVLNGAYEMVDRSKILASVKAGVNELPVIKLTPGPRKARATADGNDK